MSFRRLHGLIQRLPADSLTMRALGGDGWSLQDYLLADLFQAMAGVPHPSRPVYDKSEDPKHLQKIEEFKERVKEREEQLKAKGIT